MVERCKKCGKRLDGIWEGYEKMWKCKQCGKCCTFIIIPVVAPVDGDVLEYLEAHGIVVEGHKLLIPAQCKYLTEDNKCGIHSAKFKNCKAGSEKECREAQKQWSLLNQKS
jgi:Fe-S-cluster containining protein